MKKLQAAMRDRAAQSWKEKRLYYKVGSYFKGCRQCGEFHWEETESGKEVKRYTSGYDVFRAYDPKWMGFTYWCYTCGAKDLMCWESAEDIGLPAIRGSRDAIRAAKARFRKDHPKNDNPAPAMPTRAAEIKALEQELAALMAMLKGSN